MAEPVTLAVLGGVVLTEGIKFLYAQAGELLKAWRAARADKKAEPAPAPLPPLSPPVGVLDGPVDPGRLPNAEELERRAPELSDARRAVAAYADDADPRPVDPHDRDLLGHVGHLRELLEELYGQRLTFAGERREATGTVIRANVEARRLEDSTAQGVVHAKEAPPGAQVEAVVTAEDMKGSHVAGVDFGGTHRDRS